MLLAVDFDEYFVDVEGIAISTVLALQPSRVDGSEFDAPEANRFPSNDDPAFSQEIFDIPVAQVEAIVEPDGIGNDIRRESVAFIRVHGPILAIWCG